MRSPRILIPVAVVAGILVLLYFLMRPDEKVDQVEIFVPVKEGPLPVMIHASGELAAKRSEKIKGPDGLRSAGIYQVTISNLVPEGTIVKQGEFVASLDKTEIDSKIKDGQTEIEKINTQLEQAKIDTAIEMRALRDQVINLKFGMEEKRLNLELSKYEPKAIIQQAELDLQKSERELNQLQEKLKLTKEKSIAKIEEINASFRQQNFKLTRLLDLQREMRILAPKDGMVIYVRGWQGKRGPGSQISAWDPIVAELPDLSEMVTKAYINEVDISKVMVGQPAEVKVDAFADKAFPGKVVTMANIGEQLRNYDTKVFEVTVKLEKQDTLLRPAMTTSIQILVDSIPNARYIPLEAIQSDSVSYVFLKSGATLKKQEVVTGPSNETDIMIAAGLETGDIISLSVPDNADDLQFVYLENTVKTSAEQELDDAYEARMAKQRELAKTVKPDDMPSLDEGGGSNIIIF